MTLQATARQTATIVADDCRETFLPTLFGLRLLIIAENTVYHVMERLSPYDYRGGFWNFYEYGGRPLFLAPASRSPMRIESGLTEFRGEVSAEAAGIIATLFVLSNLALRHDPDHLAEAYHRLAAYSKGHAEASAIFAAID